MSKQEQLKKSKVYQALLTAGYKKDISLIAANQFPVSLDHAKKLCDDNKTAKKDIYVPNCRGSHGLVQFQTTTANFRCDACAADMEESSKMHSCRICDYDLCKACMKVAKKCKIMDRRPLCWCKVPFKLQQYDWQNNWICKNCLRQIPLAQKDHYECATYAKCAYRKITHLDCDVCVECYNSLKSEDINDFKDESEFIWKKCQVSLQMMRKVFDERMKAISDDKKDPKSLLASPSTYIIDTYSFFYEKLINRMSKQEALTWNDSYDLKLRNLYDETYAKMARDLALMRDSIHLQMSSETLKNVFSLKSEMKSEMKSDNGNNKNYNQSQTKRMSMISIEFGTILGDAVSVNNNDNGFDNGYMECSTNPNNIYKCRALQRIQFVNSQYSQFYLDKSDNESDIGITFLDIFNECMRFRYSVCDLLNDFNHLIHSHVNASKADIADLNNGKLIKNCGMKNCGSLQRKYRDKSAEMNGNDETKADASMYDGCVGNDERMLIDSCDRIHTFMFHKQGLVNITMDDNAPDMFDDLDSENIAGSDEEISKQRTFKMNAFNARVQRAKEIQNESSLARSSHSLAESHKHSKFVTEVEENTQADNTGDGNDNAISSIPNFAFGKIFYYWGGFRRWGNYLASPAHAHLKAELLNNTICVISLEQWNRLILKAARMALTSRGKSMVSINIGKGNQDYEIPFGQPISICHLMSILLYTDYTSVQYKFKKFGRRLLGNDSWANVRDRNLEIANWCKLFTESIIFWGAKPTRGDYFYHGLSCKLLFKQFIPKFNLPLSTTDDIEVANHFGNGKGIILVLTPSRSSRDRYVGVSWISDFPEERERLFFAAYDLNISDIRECGENRFNRNEYYLAALGLFDKLLKNQFFHRDTGKKVIKWAQKCLIQMIKNYCVKMEIIETTSVKLPVPNYMQELFNHFVIGKKNDKLKIVRSEYIELRDDLKCLLIQNVSEESKDMSDVVFSDFFNSFTPDKSKVEWGVEYKWCLRNEELQDFKDLREGAVKYSPNFDYKDYIQLRFDVERACASSPFVSGIGVKLLKLEGFDKIRLTWNYCVDEVKYISNGEASTLIQGGYHGCWSYENKYLQDLDVLTIRVSMNFY